MKTTTLGSPRTNSRTPPRGFTGASTIALLGLCLGGLVALGMTAGCATDEVGHTKTTSKKTIESPTEKTTVTETHEKDTKVTPH